MFTVIHCLKIGSFSVVCLSCFAAWEAIGLGYQDELKQESRAVRFADQAQKQFEAEGQPESDFRIQESLALAFVRNHHAELERYLDLLRERYPQQYKAAITDISQRAVRFDELKRRNQSLYESSIKDWKLESRIKLLAARNAMDPSDRLQNQIKELVQEQLLLRVQRLQEEKTRLEERLDRVSQQLDEAQQPNSEAVEKRVKLLTQQAERQLRQSRIQKKQGSKSDERNSEK